MVGALSYRVNYLKGTLYGFIHLFGGAVQRLLHRIKHCCGLQSFGARSSHSSVRHLKRRTNGGNLRLRVMKTRICWSLQPLCKPANPWEQSLASRLVRHPTPTAKPDGKCELPAVNPGGFSLPGFLAFGASCAGCFRPEGATATIGVVGWPAWVAPILVSNDICRCFRRARARLCPTLPNLP